MSAKPSEDSAANEFRRLKPGVPIEYVSFAGELDGERIYEIWYFKDDEYFVCFVTHNPASGFGFVGSISELIHQTSSNRRALESRVIAMREGRIRLWVASIAFLVSLLSLIALVVMSVFRGQAESATMIAAIAGVVASGAVFFFGVWAPGNIRASRDTPSSESKSGEV